MPLMTVEPAHENGLVAAARAVTGGQPLRQMNTPTTAEHPANLSKERELVDRLHKEVMGYLQQMQALTSLEPDEVLLRLSAWGARLTTIRCSLALNEGRVAANFRTKVLEPALDQIEFQFKCHSRLITMRELDLKLAGGQP